MAHLYSGHVLRKQFKMRVAKDEGTCSRKLFELFSKTVQQTASRNAKKRLVILGTCHDVSRNLFKRMSEKLPETNHAMAITIVTSL